jgi:hypothetical protein
MQAKRLEAIGMPRLSLFFRAHKLDSEEKMAKYIEEVHPSFLFGLPEVLQFGILK